MSLNNLKPHLAPAAIYAAIVLSIATFLFHPGQLFLLDMVMGQRIDLADYLQLGPSPHFPITFILYLLNQFLPIDIVQKLLLAFILFSIPCTLYSLALTFTSRWWACLAGLIYLLNPYVFERFAAGQWLVLLGYAFFPLVFAQLYQLLHQPSRRQLFIFSLAYAIFPILSIHWWYIGSAVLVLYTCIFCIYSRTNPIKAINPKPISLSLSLFLFLFLTINSFWLISFFTPGRSFAGITIQDMSAFATSTDARFGALFNILSLYGFWSTPFTLPKDIFSMWWIATLITLALTIVSLIAIRRSHQALVLTLIISSVIATIISIGYSSTITQPIVQWLSDYLPGLKGLRDTAKAVGLLAFSYAILVPLGSSYVSRILADKIGVSQRLGQISCFIIGLSIPLFTYPSLINSFNGQLQTANYPDSWHQVDQLLIHQQATKALILPWHGYLGFDFSRNHPIANPGRAYFTPPVIQSNYLDNQYLDTQLTDYDQMALAWLDQQPADISSDLSRLKSDQISHIVLFKTADYQQYQFLDHQSGLDLIYNSDDITLYRLQ